MVIFLEEKFAPFTRRRHLPFPSLSSPDEDLSAALSSVMTPSGPEMSSFVETDRTQLVPVAAAPRKVTSMTLSPAGLHAARSSVPTV